MVIEEIKNRSREIFDKNDFVERAWLFGSQARGDATLQSDIDFIIELNRIPGLDFYGLYHYLENEFKIPVDVLTDVEASELKGGAIERDKVLIYERNTQREDSDR